MNYIPGSDFQREEMLQNLGMESFDELYASLPEAAKLNKELDLPLGKSEMAVLNEFKETAKTNKVYKTIFRGAGFYRHYIPACVKAIVSDPGFVTAYTPYQAELSQGILRSIFEYQTSMCELTGMEVSNASVYDGACAAAEAMIMICNKKKKILIASNIDPTTLSVINTYASAHDIEVCLVDTLNGLVDLEDLSSKLDDEVAGIYFENPNYYGLIEECESLVSLVKESNKKVIMGVDPFSLSILKTPGELGADIAVGEGQGLGLELSFGGPYFGFMCCNKDMMRSLPGRIVGETVDRKGNTCYVLTLQAREQHIRREKASSSICSNQALCALQATVYLNALGPNTFKEIGQRACDLAHYLAYSLLKEGCELVYNHEFFNEFIVKLPVSCKDLNNKLKEKDILGGLPISENEMMFALTEVNTLQEIEVLLESLKEVKNA